MDDSLAAFDSEFKTLIDYFAIVGPSYEQLASLISDFQEGKHRKGTQCDDNDTEKDDSILSGMQENNNSQVPFEEARGRNRILEPVILARFPERDR